MKKVFVSGCFDLLHSGHIEFFRKASKYGDLYVSVGSDKTIEDLKKRPTIYKPKKADAIKFRNHGRNLIDSLINKGHKPGDNDPRRDKTFLNYKVIS